MTRARRSAFAVALLVAAGCRAGGAGEDDLAYVSDYYSFVGADAAGRVAFALDANRGRDGDDYQAELFAALYDDAAGWVDLAGSGPYANAARVLDDVPESADFRYSGTPADGVTILSEPNALTLTTRPIEIRMSDSTGARARRLGSAAATLAWQGRRLDGRVIYEFVHFDGWNRLARTYWGTWNDWQSFCLVAGEPVGAGAGDVYLQSQDADGGREVDGFAVLNGRARRLADAELTVEDSDQALGVYRWASAWSGGWPDAPEARLTLVARDRRSFGNWLIGGFAMTLVTGELTVGGRAVPVWGLGELIK